MNRKNVTIIGIIICLIYFVVTFSFIITSSKNWLIAMELSTMFAGIFMVLIVLVLPFKKVNGIQIYKTISITSVVACMIMTNVAHMVNLTVTEQLMKIGVSVPDYFQIGKWPSVEMAVDYLAWGLFMGLSFLFASLGIENELKTKKIKVTLLVCGCLCLIGFFGATIINENLWYIAPIGYGIGTIILCIELLFLDNKV